MVNDVALASELLPGTYVVLRTRSALGALVRLATRSWADHAILISAPGRCVQASTRGVTEGPLAQFAGCEAVANAAEAAGMQPGVREAIVARARSMAGDEYDWPLIFTLGLRTVGVKWGWLLRATSGKGAVICSELVAQAGQAGYQDWTGGTAQAALVTPAMLAARPGLESVAWDAVLV
jgi:hypothetical protein